MLIELIINNQKTMVNAENDEILLDTLRKKGLYSLRRGCDTSNCGLCTIWLDGKPVLSCSVLTIRAEGKAITTIEGINSEAGEFVTFLAGEGAEQCGFCSPGFIMTVLAMKRELKNPCEKDIQHYLAGNLCRCTGYVGQLRAIEKYLEVASNG